MGISKGTSRSRAGNGRGKASTGPSPVQSEAEHSKRHDSGPLAFFAALFVIALGAIQLVATFHSYALNLSDLNGLKRQEAALIAQKQDLENNISRWNDKAYITAQARERLGFVYPGEQSIHVEHPEAVTGVKPKADADKQKATVGQKPLPWYSELAYGLKKADTPLPKPQGDETVQKAEPPKSEQPAGGNASKNGQSGDASLQNSVAP
jgi:cell division protein FtsB